ncbi:hypothetical protein HZC31_01730 [Candidatus Woesearchaeota archaeon]|nr:hypothetical protein [Candidatus Woesearchaeota archaeon]
MVIAVNRIAQDILKIKELCQKILEKIDAGQFEGGKKELEQLLAFDVDEVRRLQEDVEDEELLVHARSVLQAAREAIQSIEGHKQSSTARELIKKILLLENYDLTKLINFEKFGDEAERQLLVLLEKPVLSEEEKTAFLVKVKGRVSPKLYKKIEKKLQERVQKRGPSYSPGPTYKDKDLVYLRQKIKEFLQSPYSNAIPHKEKIKIYIFGSLVNGYCNNPRKSTFGLPSDMGRLSDVDILLVVSPTLWKTVTQGMDRRQIVTLHNTQRTNPVGLDTNPGPASTGPFEKIFSFLGDINFAGKPKRPVHIVFIMDKWFLSLNLRDEPHIPVMSIVT